MQLLRFRSVTNINAPKRRRSKAVAPSVLRNNRSSQKTIDFTQLYIRHTLHNRVRGRGQIAVRRSRQWGITIVHRYTSSWSGESVELAVAQLRGQAPALELFWKRAS